MFSRTFGLLCLATLAPALAAPADDFRPQVEQELPSLLATYRDLHTHPELSKHEERTAAFLAAQLREAGYTVTEHIGKYADAGHVLDHPPVSPVDQSADPVGRHVGGQCRDPTPAVPADNQQRRLLARGEMEVGGL